MQPQFWRRASKAAHWTRLLSGLTYAHSTLDAGAERWIASLRDSRAKTSASLGGAPDLTERDPASSSKSCALPTIAVRGSSFWRTSQASLLPPPPLWTRPKATSTSARPPASWENWPTAGGTRNGSLFQRPTWAPAMGARGGSVSRGDAWATPDCNTSTYSNGHMGPNLRQQSAQWPTPSASVANDREIPESWHARAARTKSATGANNGLPLTVAATQWPTPAARDSKGANSEQHCTLTGGGQEAHGPASELRGLFAPGPADSRWPEILAAHPCLAPALEPTFRSVVDGVAFDMGDSRSARLRCVGNGVVPLQAAAAVVVLARRAGTF